MGRGGLQNGRVGHVKFYPYEKGGTKSVWVVFTQQFEVSAILKGGTKSFHSLKGGM